MRTIVGQYGGSCLLTALDHGRHTYAVIRRTGDRDPGWQRGADPADAIEVTHRVLRQPATPSRHPAVDEVADRADDALELLAHDVHELVVLALQLDLVAVPPDAGPHDRGPGGPPLATRERDRLRRQPLDRRNEVA